MSLVHSPVPLHLQDKVCQTATHPSSLAEIWPSTESAPHTDALDYMSVHAERKPVQSPPKLELLPSETTSPVDEKFGVDFNDIHMQYKSGEIDSASAHAEYESEKSQHELVGVESRRTSVDEIVRDTGSEESSPRTYDSA